MNKKQAGWPQIRVRISAEMYGVLFADAADRAVDDNNQTYHAGAIINELLRAKYKS